MRIHPKNLLQFGTYVDSVARDQAKFYTLLNNPNGTLNVLFTEDLAAPGVPQIVVHQNTEHVMHLVIPWHRDIDDAINDPDPYTYPPEYCPGNPEFIDPETRREDAIKFRIGDYTLNQCM